MFFNRKDEDDEYKRYMDEREREKDYSSDSYNSTSYSEPVNNDTHHYFDCGEEPCEYSRNAKDFDYASRTLKKHLMPGERIIWAGTGVSSGSGGCVEAVIQRFFGLFWLGFSIFWTMGATAAGGAFGLFGVPFIIIGVMLVFGKTKSGICYAVTDQRVLMLDRGRVTGISLTQISDPQLVNAGNGRYSVTFTSNIPMFMRGNNTFRNVSGYGFYNITDGQAAYKAICDAIYVHQH